MSTPSERQSAPDTDAFRLTAFAERVAEIDKRDGTAVVTTLATAKALLSEISSLRSSLATAEQDAARYRFLRSRLWIRPEKNLRHVTRLSIGTQPGCSFLPDEVPPPPFPGTGDGLDSCLDAAIKLAASPSVQGGAP